MPETPELEPTSLPPRRRERTLTPQERKRNVLTIAMLAAAGAAVASLVLLKMKDTGVYSKPVDELLNAQERFVGKAVRVEGNLVHGTLVRRETPCEYRFEIEQRHQALKVRFAKCIVPDTFKDVPGMDVGVTVEGRLLASGDFEADNVLAKCPSKYDMQERQSKGESMPHAAL